MLFFLGIESFGNTPCSANLDTTAKDSAHHPCRESPSLPKPTPPAAVPAPRPAVQAGEKARPGLPESRKKLQTEMTEVSPEQGQRVKSRPLQ